jgi:hypothetical protein
MLALSLWHPWASLILFREKRCETRSWPAPRSALGQPLAIHATKTWHRAALIAVFGEERLDGGEVDRTRPIWQALKRQGVTMLADLPLGAVIATCRLVDCVATDSLRSLHRWRHLLTVDELDFGDFSPGRFAWVLDDVRPVEPPVPASGKQGLWVWEAGDVARRDGSAAHDAPDGPHGAIGAAHD